MNPHSKRKLDAAITALKRDGYSVLLLLFDKNHDKYEYPCVCGVFKRQDCPQHGARPSALEVLCSETNDPQLLAAMAQDALAEIAQPKSISGRIN